jgi:hypothetical protein
MFASTIPQVDGQGTGVHLIWSGPHTWVYSVRGWTVERRRVKEERDRERCDGLVDPGIVAIRQAFEARLDFGALTYRLGTMPRSTVLDVQPDDRQSSRAVEVFTLLLDAPQPWVRVEVTAKFGFVYALRGGKAVAVAGPGTGVMSFEFAALGIEIVVASTLDPQSIRFCVREPRDDDWREAVTVASGLQIPIEQLIPSLGGPDDEFAEAKKRLLPGETLDQSEFARLADTVRAGVQAHGPIRPIDQVLLLREDTAQSFEELVHLDPLRVLQSHPKWRRVLGFGLFDDDPRLVVGDTYEYRITGFFPERDLVDRVYGFHTVPSQTMLPATFWLDDLRVHLPQPSTVELVPPAPSTGKVATSRRGIRLAPQSQFFWRIPSLQSWSIAIGFPTPVDHVVLELDAGHSLEFTWRPLLGALKTSAAVPSGASVRLDFSEPAEEVRLQGRGFLFSIRIPVATTDRIVPVSVVLPPVTLMDALRPAPPLNVEVQNLQLPKPVPTDDQQPAEIEPMHAMGFLLRWRPSPLGGVTMWPSDAQTPPPLEAALFEVEHNELSTTEWQPLLAEENWMLGDRDVEPSETRIVSGADLMEAFPEMPRLTWAGGLDLMWRDVFDFEQGDNVIVRRLPAPGTEHRYRVWTVDPVGRRSLAPTMSSPVRLEKHVPPPLPVGPNDVDASTLALPEPIGVQARALVKEAPDLTAADRALLGSDNNAIVVRWGWHAQQRDQDLFAREFRVYLSTEPLDSVKGTLASVLPTGVGKYEVILNLDRPVATDAAKGTYLEAGYAFRIDGHSSGTTITAQLSVSIVQPTPPVPQTGPIELSLRLTPDKTRAPAWTERVEVQPITASSQYQAVLRNRLTLTAAQPRDTVWVGVSSADDQSYVPDQLAPAESRPGNESAIVPVACSGRYHGRPVFDIPPPLEDVPEHRSPEPTGRPLYFDLDLSPYVTGFGLSSIDLVQPYRAAVDAVLGAYALDEADRIMAVVVDKAAASEVDVEVTLANPTDRANVVAGLQAADRRILANRYAVFLAASHPFRHRLFERVTDAPVPLGPFKETLPTEPGRYVYLLRKADAAGHLSAGDAVAKVVMRVPSVSPGGSPVREPAQAADAAGTLRLRAAPDPELTHLLVFSQVAADGQGPLPPADVLRVPNRPDLYPSDGIRLRAPSGAILAPQVKDLSDGDVTLDAQGDRQVVLQLTAGAGERLRVWACCLSRDGVPSATAGPWTLGMPLAPLQAPTLTVTGPAAAPSFAWTWPTGPTHDVALQTSADGVEWSRVSPVFGDATTSYAYGSGAAGQQYRLVVMSPDGRTAASNVVAP